MLDDMMEYLKKIRDQLCENCPGAQKSVVTTLSADEMKEWAIIQTEDHTIKKELDKLKHRQEMIMARKAILFGKIRIRHDEIKSNLTIKEGKVFRIECNDNCPTSNLFQGPDLQ